MTNVKKIFTGADGEPVGEVLVQIDFDRCEKSIALKMSGNIMAENATILREFIRDVSCFPATRWTVDISELHTLSFNGLKALVKLARIVKRRGHGPEIVAANPTMLALIHETGCARYFEMNLTPSPRVVLRRHVFEIDPGEPVR